MDQMLSFFGTVILAAFLGTIPSAFFGRVTGDWFYKRDNALYSDSPQTMVYCAVCAGLLGALFGPVLLGTDLTCSLVFTYSFVGSLLLSSAICLVVLAGHFFVEYVCPLVRAVMNPLFRCVDKLMGTPPKG